MFNSKQKRKPQKKKNITFYILDDAFTVKHSIYSVLNDEAVKRNMEANFYAIGEGILYEELRDTLAKNKADLYFLDTELEDGTGWDLVPLIKETFKDSHIIMLSDGLNPNLKAKRQQYEQDVFSIIEKPFQPGIVIGVLNELVSFMNSCDELSKSSNKKKKASDELSLNTFVPTKKKKQSTFTTGTSIGEKGSLDEVKPFMRKQIQEEKNTALNDFSIDNLFDVADSGTKESISHEGEIHSKGSNSNELFDFDSFTDTTDVSEISEKTSPEESLSLWDDFPSETPLENKDFSSNNSLIQDNRRNTSDKKEEKTMKLESSMSTFETFDDISLENDGFEKLINEEKVLSFNENYSQSDIYNSEMSNLDKEELNYDSSLLRNDDILLNNDDNLLNNEYSLLNNEYSLLKEDTSLLQNEYNLVVNDDILLDNDNNLIDSEFDLVNSVSEIEENARNKREKTVTSRENDIFDDFDLKIGDFNESEDVSDKSFSFDDEETLSEVSDDVFAFDIYEDQEVVASSFEQKEEALEVFEFDFESKEQEDEFGLVMETKQEHLFEVATSSDEFEIKKEDEVFDFEISEESFDFDFDTNQEELVLNGGSDFEFDFQSEGQLPAFENEDEEKSEKLLLTGEDNDFGFDFETDKQVVSFESEINEEDSVNFEGISFDTFKSENEFQAEGCFNDEYLLVEENEDFFIGQFSLEKKSSSTVENFDFDFDLSENDTKEGSYQESDNNSMQNPDEEFIFFEDDSNLNFEYSNCNIPYSEEANQEELLFSSSSIESETLNQFDFEDEESDDELDSWDDGDEEFFIRPPMKRW